MFGEGQSWLTNIDQPLKRRSEHMAIETGLRGWAGRGKSQEQDVAGELPQYGDGWNREREGAWARKSVCDRAKKNIIYMDTSKACSFDGFDWIDVYEGEKVDNLRS